MGRKPKEVDLVAQSEAMAEMLAGDVADVAEMSKYPVIRGLRPKDQAIMCAYVYGS